MPTTPAIKDWRDSREYRVWRVEVVRRDGRCKICNSIKGREAHHICHATYFPEKRFNAENGVTLCRGCHTQFHTNYKKSFREKCDRSDFLNFVVLVRHYMELEKNDANE